ncbi:hypothetical protein MTO96_026449 [Rhipicephalus appendiculatus]
MANASGAHSLGHRIRVDAFVRMPFLLRLKCTRLESDVCQLLRHTDRCNQVLRHAGFQLRADSGSEPGNLIVVRVPGACRDTPADPGSCRCDGKMAVELLHGLLRAHRCIVSVEV